MMKECNKKWLNECRIKKKQKKTERNLRKPEKKRDQLLFFIGSQDPQHLLSNRNKNNVSIRRLACIL